MSESVLIDLTNYKDRRGSRVPEDRYAVKIIDAELATASTGNQMINVIFEIIEGEFKGQTLTDRYVQTEKGIFRTVGLLQGIGMPTPRKRLNLKMATLLNKTLYVDVSDGEPYNGVVRSEVRGWGKIPAGAVSDGDADDDLDEFSGDAEDLDDVATDDPWAGTVDGEADATEEPTLPLAGKKKAAAKPAPTPAADADDEDVDLDDIEL